MSKRLKREMEARTALLSASQKVIVGLDARIKAAQGISVPVFDGIGDLHDAINQFRRAYPNDLPEARNGDNNAAI